MLQIAICDEDEEFLSLLRNEIKNMFQNRNVLCRVSAFSDSRVFINDYKKERFDVVFMDTKMRNMDGFEAAKRIRKINEDVYIIFISVETDLVYDSFEFSPFGFIPKGDIKVMKRRLEQTIKRLIDNMPEYEKVPFEQPFGERIFLEVNKILFLQSNSNYVVIHTSEPENIRIRCKLVDVQEQLAKYHFVRIHQRLLVNMSHIQRIDLTDNKVFMDDGRALNISRTYKRQAEKVYMGYQKNLNK